MSERPTHTVSEIARWVGGRIIGDETRPISGVAGLEHAEPSDLSFLARRDYIKRAQSSRAGAVVVGKDIVLDGKTLIQVEDAELAFNTIAARFASTAHRPQGRDASARIDPTARIAEDVAIGAGVVIGPRTVVEKGVVVYHGCVLGADVHIGEGTVLYPRVVIHDRCRIGRCCVLHAGCVIGADGFGYITRGGRHIKIPHVGIVRIGDEVEIGANTTIDRARLDETVIGDGTKIDNLVQIGHNTRIGRHCLICGQVGISGSCVVEDHAVLAGQVGLADHVRIGEGAVVAAGSGVPNDVPAKEIYWGFPARPLKQARRVHAALQQLPQWLKQWREVKHKLLSERSGEAGEH